MAGSAAVAGASTVVYSGSLDHVPHLQEDGALQSHFDEGGLQAW